LTSVASEEFHCTPSQADEEDAGRVRRILRLRRFRDSWSEIEGGVEQKDLTKTGMLETALLVQIKRARGEV